MALPIYSKRSEADLLEIWVYSELRPEIGSTVRVFSTDEYAIFFRPHAGSIGIMRIGQGSRDWASFDWDVL